MPGFWQWYPSRDPEWPKRPPRPFPWLRLMLLLLVIFVLAPLMARYVARPVQEQPRGNDVQQAAEEVRRSAEREALRAARR